MYCGDHDSTDDAFVDRQFVKSFLGYTLQRTILKIPQMSKKSFLGILAGPYEKRCLKFNYTTIVMTYLQMNSEALPLPVFNSKLSSKYKVENLTY